MSNSVSDNLWAKQRRDMVSHQLKPRGITNQRVLDIMGIIPREIFLPHEHRHLAYEDRAVPIGLDQTMSQPYIVARMTELLAVDSSHRVLEIGTGSGYQTAILASLAAKVISVERHSDLLACAKQNLAQLQLDNISYILSDGSMGSPVHAPFHRILVTAAGPAIPHALSDQLADGGRLVMPVGDMKEQTLHCVQRRGQRFHHTRSIRCRFVKLIGKQGWPESTAN